MAKTKSKEELQQQIGELTQDLQRLHADFENYRKRMDSERINLVEVTKAATIMKLLPVVDDIERAVGHVPAELESNQWAQGVAGLARNVHKSLKELGLSKIDSDPGVLFDPEVHEAVLMDAGEGEHEVIAETLRAGYKMGDQVIRPAMVKVTHGQLAAE